VATLNYDKTNLSTSATTATPIFKIETTQIAAANVQT
jgi:hypothetical protein